MHRNRTWLIGSSAEERIRNRTLPVEGGDGSTLSLDFTTGVLDPRLTFTRGTNATFINSNGLVQYADANMVVNADFVGAGTGNTPTSWTGSAGINLSIPATGVRRAETTTAAQNWIASPNFTTNSGLTYSTSVQLNAVSGQHYANTITITGSPTLVGYYLNGSSVGQFSTAQPGLVTIVWTATGTHGVRVGIGCTGANVANAVCEFTQPRTVPGNITQPAYFANSSTSAAYHGPRFDYDPTSIGTPRGLLIEGSAINLQPYSEDLSQTGTWTQQALAGITANASGITDPAGGTSASKIRSNSAVGTSHLVYSTRSTVSGTAYTMSAWVRAAEYNFAALHFASGANRYTVVFNLTTGEVTQTNTYGSPTGTGQNAVKFGNWWRLSVTMNAADTTSYPHICLSPTGTPSVNSFGQPAFTGTAESGVYVWGAQLETGVGASSYIPTGASTGNRAYDHCYATGANFNSWFSVGAGTMVVVSDNQKILSASSQNLAAMISDDSLNNYIRMGFKVGGSANEYLLTVVGGSPPFQGAADSGYAPPRNTVYRMAYAWDTNNFGIVANGGAVVTDSSGTVAGAGVLTRLVVGGDFVAAPNDIYFKNGHILSLKYFPTRLPNSQLQALTT